MQIYSLFYCLFLFPSLSEAVVRDQELQVVWVFLSREGGKGYTLFRRVRHTTRKVFLRKQNK